jgi:signal transduction histidine kinase
VLAIVGIAGDPGRVRALLLVAGCDFTIAALGLLVPWNRLHRNAPAVLGVTGFAVLGLSTWSFGGVATGTGPFLVLLYVWAALHLPRWILLAFAGPALLAYLLPLILTHQPPEILSSALVLLPIAVGIALLVEAQARHLREDHERLARIEHWRSAMTGTLAHDVRSPLSTVRFALEELREDATGHAERMLDAALRQTARIERLADSLLDVHRIDSTGHLTLDRKLYPAGGLVRDALSYVNATGLATDVDDDLLICVDKQRFEQIILNLVGNALRYGRPPVVVGIHRDGAVDRLEVRDHGPGIPDALRDTLFGQFAVGGAEGIGLGLWIVRQLAEVHGGRASAEARDPGVAMVVTFPAPAS